MKNQKTKLYALSNKASSKLSSQNKLENWLSYECMDILIIKSF